MPQKSPFNQDWIEIFPFQKPTFFIFWRGMASEQSWLCNKGKNQNEEPVAPQTLVADCPPPWQVSESMSDLLKPDFQLEFFCHRLSNALGPAGGPSRPLPPDSNLQDIGRRCVYQPFCQQQILCSPARAGFLWQCHFLGGLPCPGKVLKIT